MKRFAVVPGSFDPVTLGHADLIRRAAAIFGRCEVVVMNNLEKEYRFTLAERCDLCRAAFHGEEDIRVTSYEGMLYEFLAGRPGAVLVKGVRNEKDYLYEREQADFNFEHCGVETLYLDAREDLRDLSATLVRGKLSDPGEWEPYLPEKVATILHHKL